MVRRSWLKIIIAVAIPVIIIALVVFMVGAWDLFKSVERKDHLL